MDGKERLTKGVNLVGLVKILKIRRRDQALDGLPEAAQSLLNERILVSSWYPLARLLELLDFSYTHLLGRDPERALQMGCLGGKEILSSAHRIYIREDPVASLLAMTGAWPSYFNFGSMLATPVTGRSAVELTIRNYPDVPEVHAMTIVGWHLAMAHLSGATRATAKVLRHPWRGDPDLVHRILL